MKIASLCSSMGDGVWIRTLDDQHCYIWLSGRLVVTDRYGVLFSGEEYQCRAKGDRESYWEFGERCLESYEKLRMLK